jgi:hypothetical protein
VIVQRCRDPALRSIQRHRRVGRIRPDEAVVLDPIEFLRAAMVWCEDYESLGIACLLAEAAQMVSDLLEVDAVGDHFGLEPQRRRALNRHIWDRAVASDLVLERTRERSDSSSVASRSSSPSLVLTCSRTAMSVDVTRFSPCVYVEKSGFGMI